MYNLKGNDHDWVLFDLQRELKRDLKEPVVVDKRPDSILITIAYNWILQIPHDDMDDLLDSVGEPKGFLKDTFDKYKARYMIRKV